METQRLIDRIASGMTTVDDAQEVRRIVQRLRTYERALHWIAVYGAGTSAMTACRALAGEEVVTWPIADAH